MPDRNPPLVFGSRRPDKRASVREMGFRDQTALTRALQIVLGIFVFAYVASFISDIVTYDLIQYAAARLSSGSLDADLDANDARQFALTYLRFATDVVTAIIFACWVYRASCNVRALGATGLAFTPGWSVGWYFIPIACLWKPFQAMRELWNGTKSPQHWQSEPTDSLLRYWWTAWLTSNVLAWVYFVANDNLDIPSAFLVTILSLIDDVLWISTGTLAGVVVTRLTRMQMSQPKWGTQSSVPPSQRTPTT